MSKIGDIAYLTKYLAQNIGAKNADEFAARAGSEIGAGNLFDGLENYYNTGGGDTVDFSSDKYYANGNTMLMLDSKNKRIAYINTTTGEAEFKSLDQLAPSLKGQNIQFGKDNLYMVTDPAEGVKETKNGNIGVSGDTVLKIKQLADSKGLSMTDAVKEYYLSQNGGDIAKSLEALTGQSYNKDCGQGFLADFRNKAFDTIAAKLAEKMKPKAETASDNKDIVVDNYQGFNLDLNTVLNANEKLTLQQSAKIDKDLFDKNADYKNSLVDYCKKLYPAYADKITADGVKFLDDKGKIGLEVEGKPIEITADFQNHANGQVQELSKEDNKALTDIMSGSKTPEEKQKAISAYLYGEFGSDPNTVSKKDSTKSRSRTWFVKSWADSMAKDIYTKYTNGQPVTALNVPVQDGIGVSERKTIDATVKWDPMILEDNKYEYTFADDEDNDGQFDGKKELLGYDKNWADMVKHDADGDGKISGDELDKLMVVRKDKATGKTEFISARKAGMGEIDLSSHKDKNEDINADQTLIGTFNVKMATGQTIEAQQTADTDSWLNKFVDGLKKGLGIQ